MNPCRDCVYADKGETEDCEDWGIDLSFCWMCNNPKTHRVSRMEHFVNPPANEDENRVDCYSARVDWTSCAPEGRYFSPKRHELP